MTPNTLTMFQWMTRPIARFASTATASTTTTAIAANVTELAQPRCRLTWSFDFDFDLGFGLDFLPAFDLASVPLRDFRA